MFIIKAFLLEATLSCRGYAPLITPISTNTRRTSAALKRNATNARRSSAAFKRNATNTRRSSAVFTRIHVDRLRRLQASKSKEDNYKKHDLIRRPHQGHKAVRFLPVSPHCPPISGFRAAAIPPPARNSCNQPPTPLPHRANAILRIHRFEELHLKTSKIDPHGGPKFDFS